MHQSSCYAYIGGTALSGDKLRETADMKYERVAHTLAWLRIIRNHRGQQIE